MDKKLNNAVFLSKRPQHLGKQGVCPGKPASGVIGRIVFIERFVHIIRAGGGGSKHGKAIADLRFACGGERLHGKGDMPDLIRPRVGTANALCRFAGEIEGIIF